MKEKVSQNVQKCAIVSAMSLKELSILLFGTFVYEVSPIWCCQVDQFGIVCLTLNKIVYLVLQNDIQITCLSHH